MNTVVYIHSYPGATDTLRMLWPGFKLLGWPLAGVETTDGVCKWPEPIRTIKAGRNAYFTQDRRNLPERLLATFDDFLASEYEYAVILEYDTLILGPMDPPQPGFTAHIGGYQAAGSDAPYFLYTPWIADRNTAQWMTFEGRRVIAEGVCDRGCNGAPDQFIGIILDRLGIQFRESGTFSANTIDTTQIADAANKAYREGCNFFHGVKREEHRRAVLGV
jgi:hypothetical protein